MIAWMFLQRSAAGNSDESAAGLAGLQDSPLLLKSEALSTVSPVAYILAHFDFVHVMKARLAEADLQWPVGRLTLMMLLSGAITAVMAGNFRSVPAWGVLAAMCAGGSAPYFYVLRKRSARLSKFEEQLPEALDFLSRALRAGHPFAVCLEMLADESPAPLAAEMRKACEERQLGLSWDQALNNLAERIPLVDVSFFTAAVQLQSRTGGKLGEVLGRLAETMRERFALRGEVRAIATHGRMTGMMLTAIPIAVVVIMAVVNPAYLEILLGNEIGRTMVMISGVCLVLAHFVIRRIVNIKV